jgi:hypothetical protein
MRLHNYEQMAADLSRIVGSQAAIISRNQESASLPAYDFAAHLRVAYIGRRGSSRRRVKEHLEQVFPGIQVDTFQPSSRRLNQASGTYDIVLSQRAVGHDSTKAVQQDETFFDFAEGPESAVNSVLRYYELTQGELGQTTAQ